MKNLKIVYSSGKLQQKWEAAISYLRTESKQPWVLDKQVTKK